MLAFTEHGEGTRAIILLHGFLGAGRNLASLARRWAPSSPRTRFILPDLLGHGLSPPLPPAATLGEVASAIVALAEHLGLHAPVDLVGHSLGGRVALVTRALDPQRFRAVTLLDVTPYPMTMALAELDLIIEALCAAPDHAASRSIFRDYFAARGLGEKTSAWLITNLKRDTSGGYAWRIDREALRAFATSARREDLSSLLAGHESVTLCVRGGRSPFVPSEEAARLVEAGVRVHTLPHAGHQVHTDALVELLELLPSLHGK